MKSVPRKYRLDFIPIVTNVLAKDNYKIEITFKDGKIKVYDVSKSLKNNIGKSLADKNIFNNPKVVDGAVTWEFVINGETIVYDIDPTVSYVDSVEVQVSK